MTERIARTIKGLWQSAEVFIHDRPLPLKESLKSYPRSPLGFSWGYKGAGPAQLAYAILLDYTNDPDLALAYHHYFKDDVISKLPYGRDFELPLSYVQAWLDNLDDERRREAAKFSEPDSLRLTPTEEELFADPEFAEEYYWRKLVELNRRIYQQVHETGERW